LGENLRYDVPKNLKGWLLALGWQDEIVQKLQQGTLRRLEWEDRFPFACHAECMGRCCRKADIVLDPWDLEVLARGLGLNTTDFVDAYAELQIEPETLWPYVRLRDVTRGPCAFLDNQGLCRVYPFRPRNCRAYPVGRRVTVTWLKNGKPDLDATYFLLNTPTTCLGPQSTRIWTLREWLEASECLDYFQRATEHLVVKSLARELKYHKWWEGPPHMLLMLFLFEPDLIREEFGITEQEVNHVELYRRRMQALQLFLTDQAARHGYFLETGNDSGAACALDLSGTAPDLLEWMLSILRGEQPDS
jgi:Fe-S-cluster containining protein